LYQQTTLPNGLRLVSAPMPHTRAASLGIFIGVGSRYEATPQAGVAHFIEHIVFKGTENFPNARLIAEAIEGVGGYFNAATDKEITAYWCKVPAVHFKRAAAVLADLVRRPVFAAAEIEKERNVIIEEINMVADSPQQRSEIICDRLLWPRHPLGRDVAGSRKTVTGLTHEQIRDFWQAGYRPENTVVSLAGDIDEASMAQLASHLGDWRSDGPALTRRPFRGHPDRRRLRLEQRDTEQANICLALPGLPLQHPRRHALDLLNIILGESSSSRLFAEIRDNRSLTYDIQSQPQYYTDSGSLNIYAACDPDNLTALVTAILGELERLHRGVPAAELAQAKELARGRLLLRHEDSRNVVAWTGSQQILTGEVLDSDQVMSRIAAVSRADLSRMIKTIIRLEEVRLAVVGPVADAAPLEALLAV